MVLLAYRRPWSVAAGAALAMPIFYEQSVVLLLPAIRLWWDARPAAPTTPRRGASDRGGGRAAGGGRDLARSNGGRALVVEALHGRDHQLDAEPVVDEVVAGAAEHVGQLVVAAAAARSPRPAPAGPAAERAAP